MAREARVKGIGQNQWMESSDHTPLYGQVVEWNFTGESIQAVAGDLGLAAGVGSSTSGSPVYLAGVMGNVIASSINFTATQNIIAGMIAKYDHVGTNASTYPSAALIAEIGTQSTAAYAAVMAVMGGDAPGTTSAVAAFGVDWQNSTHASAFSWGLDLQGNGTHDSFLSPRYSKGDIRLGGRIGSTTVSAGENVVIFRNAGAPVNGTTGANNTGPGSLCIDTTNAKLYINTNTLASPTWTVVGTQT